MSAEEGAEAQALASAVRLVARVFAEELARAFGPVLAARASVEAPARPAPAPPAGPPFGLRPPDAIAEDEVFASALRFLEERAGEVGGLLGRPGKPARAPVAAPEPTIGDVFTLGASRSRRSESPDVEVFP